MPSQQLFREGIFLKILKMFIIFYFGANERVNFCFMFNKAKLKKNKRLSTI
jgi:hypothetical protein